MWWGDLLLNEGLPAPPGEREESAAGGAGQRGGETCRTPRCAVWADVGLGPEQNGVRALAQLLEAPDLPLVKGPWHITDQLVLANVFQAKDLRAVRRLQVTHVLNLAPESVATDIRYYAPPQTLVRGFRSIDAVDSESCDMLSSIIPESLKFISSALSSSEHSSDASAADESGERSPAVSDKPRILVNCLAGMNRSVTVVVAYLMAMHGMALLDAVRHVWSRRGSHVLSNRAFRAQLVRLALRLDSG